MFLLEQKEIEVLWDKWGNNSVAVEDVYDCLQDFLRAFISEWERKKSNEALSRH